MYTLWVISELTGSFVQSSPPSVTPEKRSPLQATLRPGYWVIIYLYNRKIPFPSQVAHQSRADAL